MTRSAFVLLTFSISLLFGCGALDDPGSEVGETDQDRAQVAAGMTGINIPGGAAPGGAAGAAANPGVVNPAAVPSPPTDDGPPPKRWLVLSNFRKQSQGIQTFGETYRVDYRWAEGTPADTKTYNLVIEMKGQNGQFEIKEVKPVPLNPSGGTAVVGLERQFGTETPSCYIARKKGDDWEPISGKIEMGSGASTAATSNPSTPLPGAGGPDTTVAGGVPEVVVTPEPGVSTPVVPEEQPIPVPAGLPEKPISPRGSASYSVEDVVLKIARADYDGLKEFVADDVEGDLALLRAGKLPVPRANEIRKIMARVRVTDKKSLSNGSRQFILESASGKRIEMMVRKRQGRFLVVEMEIDEPEGGAGTTPNF